MPQTYNLPAQFDASCRVWVFISNRKLSATESAWANEQLQQFTASWQTHGQTMNATGFVFEDLALVLVANEEGVKASGCSMDKINHQVKRISEEIGINCLDRMNTLVLDQNEWILARYDANEQRRCITAATLELGAIIG